MTLFVQISMPAILRDFVTVTTSVSGYPKYGVWCIAWFIEVGCGLVWCGVVSCGVIKCCLFII